MKTNIIKSLVLALCMGTACGCSHDDDEIIYFPVFQDTTDKTVHNTYDYPNWTAKQSEDFSVSMTVVCTLPDSLQANFTEEDYMAAILDGQCRAVTKPTDGKFFLNVVGTTEEGGELEVYYWNASKRYLFQVSEIVQFVPNHMYGSVDEPYVFKMKQK